MNNKYVVGETRILLIHPCEIIRCGIGVLLQQYGAKNVILFDSCESYLKQQCQPGADLILVHYSQCSKEGSIGCMIEQTGAHVALMASSDAFHKDSYESIVQRIIEGITGFLDMNEPINTFMSELEDIIAGDVVISGKFIGNIVPNINKNAEKLTELLSQREIQILELVAEGCINSEIGKELNISPHTVKGHLTHILTKLNLRNRQQAVSYVIERRLSAGNVHGLIHGID